MSILSQKIYFINTVNKLEGRNGDFKYEINIPQTENFDRVCVLQASIPLSFYLVQDGVNTFILRESINGNNFDRTITIPIGNYNYQTFQETIINLLNSNSPTGLTYSCTYSKPQAKFTWSAVVRPPPLYIAYTGTFSLIFNSHISQQFGFDKVSTNTSVNQSLTSENTVNFIPESTIYIHSDISDSDTDILQEVYSNNTVPYSQVTYQLTTNVEAYSKKLKTDRQNAFRFYITNEEGDILNTNGQRVLLTLLIYKKDNFTSYFREFISWFVQKAELLLSGPEPQIQ